MVDEALAVRPSNEIVIAQGKPVLHIRATRENAEKLVKDLARTAKTKVDWHIDGKKMIVRHFGDGDSRLRLEGAIDNAAGSFNCQILQRHKLSFAELFDTYRASSSAG